MAGKFDIIFEHMSREDELLSDIDEMKGALEQSREIRELIEIMEETMPPCEPFLYSGT